MALAHKEIDGVDPIYRAQLARTNFTVASTASFVGCGRNCNLDHNRHFYRRTLLSAEPYWSGIAGGSAGAEAHVCHREMKAAHGRRGGY